MNERSGKRCQIHGTVSPGFESVRTLYERDMQVLAEDHTQLCVYYQGEKVVDLWASTLDDASFSPDSLINVFSSGKSLAAIAMATLVDKGLLDYKANITDYWPEFGGSGKGDTTVADLMRHESGLAAFNASIVPDDLLPENIKLNKVGSLIEGHPPKFRTGNAGRREYHAITRGWIANEVFRRVDPAGRTIGEVLREEISSPLEADAVIGVKDSELRRIIPVRALGIGFELLESLKPKFLGRRIKHHFFQIFARLIPLIPGLRTLSGQGAAPPLVGMEEIEFFNTPAVSQGETPSAGSKCSARGLAKIAAMMSAGGKWEGRSFLSPDAWRSMHAEPVEADIGFGSTHFTQGGVNLFVETDATSSGLVRAFNEGRQGFYGWMGLGGSIFQWHPEHEIGFAFVPSALHILELMDERGKEYQVEALRCVEALKR